MRFCLLALLLFAVPAFAQHGIYAQQTTYRLSESPVVYVSTNTGSSTTVTATHQYNFQAPSWSPATVTEPAQTDSATPWIDAGWTRTLTIAPLEQTGIWEIAIPTGVLDAATIGATASNPTTTELSKALIYIIPDGAPHADDVLIVSSAMTSMAYGKYGGRSLYDDPYNEQVGRLRPGIESNLDARSRDFCFRVVAASKRCLYVDDFYIQDNPEYLNNFTMIVLPGLHEYATWRLRQAYKDYVAQGGRMLVLGGEAFIRQIRDEGSTYLGYRAPETEVDPITTDADTSNDYLAGYHVVSSFINDPEAALLGSSLWMGFNPTGTAGSGDDWYIERSGHWLFTGGGFSDGDALKSGSALSSADFVDGLKLTWHNGLPYVADHDQYGVPHDTLVLATVATSNARPTDCGTGTFQADFESNVSCQTAGYGVITISEHPNGLGGVVLHIPEVGIGNDAKTDANLATVLENAIETMANPASFDPFDGFPLRAPTVGTISEVPSGGAPFGLASVFFSVTFGTSREYAAMPH